MCVSLSVSLCLCASACLRVLLSSPAVTMSAESLPPIEEWPDYNDQPWGADPLKQDINSPYNKVREERTAFFFFFSTPQLVTDPGNRG